LEGKKHDAPKVPSEPPTERMLELERLLCVSYYIGRSQGWPQNWERPEEFIKQLHRMGYSEVTVEDLKRVIEIQTKFARKDLRIGP